MTVSAAHAAAFYRESVKRSTVWTLTDSDGIPAPRNASGQRAMPFWSAESRVRKVIASSPAYAGFEPVEVPLGDFTTRWLVGLERDGILVGLNWSGLRATGYDVDAPDVARSLAAAQA